MSFLFDIEFESVVRNWEYITEVALNPDKPRNEQQKAA